MGLRLTIGNILRLLISQILLFVLLTSQGHAEDCVLRVGWEIWPPYFIKNSGGPVKVSGIEVDLMEEAARRANCSVRWVEIPWARLMTELKDGTMDVATSAAKSDERAQFGHYSVTYINTPSAMFFRKGEANRYRINKAEDLIDTKLVFGLVRGAIYDPAILNIAEKGLTGARPIFVAGADQAMPMLAGRRIDVYLEDLVVGRHVAKKMLLSQEIEAHPLLLHNAPSHYLFSKKSVSDEVVRKFDAALSAMVAEKLPEQVISRYIASGY